MKFSSQFGEKFIKKISCAHAWHAAAAACGPGRGRVTWRLRLAAVAGVVACNAEGVASTEGGRGGRCMPAVAKAGMVMLEGGANGAAHGSGDAPGHGQGVGRCAWLRRAVC